MVLSLVTTASYGGNLRAYLMNPEPRDPIDTLEEVVESGLPFNMAMYGESTERLLAESDDPVKRRFWREKVVVEYDQFPYDRVGTH